MSFYSLTLVLALLLSLMLTVTLRVTPSGLVIMEVERDVSDAQPTTTGVSLSPTIKTRNITSTVAVKHRQAVTEDFRVRLQGLREKF